MTIAGHLFVQVNAAMAKLLYCMSPGSSVTKGGELRIVVKGNSSWYPYTKYSVHVEGSTKNINSILRLIVTVFFGGGGGVRIEIVQTGSIVAELKHVISLLAAKADGKALSQSIMPLQLLLLRHTIVPRRT